MSESAWVVLKFGGTSVSSAERWQIIAEVIRERITAGLRPLVVCSALSGVSNQLESLLAGATQGEIGHEIAAIEARHRTFAETLGIDATRLDGELAELRRLATGASLLGEVSPRVHARLMATGELLATRMGAAYLAQLGLDVGWLDARTLLTATDDSRSHPHRHYLSARCHDDVDDALRTRLDAEPQAALLTQGFIANDARGETVLLGRGGSDTSAAYLAARLNAERCEIWTDVPGMFSANPRAVPAARLLRLLGYDEAQEIASTGAKVLHPRCIAPVRRHRIPLQIRCTPNPEMEGTEIRSDIANESAQVKAISLKTDVTLVSMDTLGMWQQVGFLADVFAVFREAGLSIDLVSTSETNVTVSLDPSANVLDAETVASLKDALAPFCRARIIGRAAAISLVGRNIRAILHKLAPVLAVFEEQPIHLVSQAASDLNVTFVVDQSQSDRLVARLHQLLFGNTSDASSVFGPTWAELFDDDGGDVSQDFARPWWIESAAQLVALATEVGTPRYVYAADVARAAARRLTAMHNIDRVLYAIKANPNTELLRRFHALGVAFECVSPGELAHVFDTIADLDPTRVLYTPNFAPRGDYVAGFERGVHVTVDNISVLREWPETFRDRAIFVRLDPGRGRGHHAYVRTAGKQSKFGVSPDEIEELIELVAALQIRVVGLHAHAGSGIRTPDQWAETAVFLASLAERFGTVDILDLGGGLGIPEKPGDLPLDIAAVDATLAPVRAAHPRFQLWLEPGRYLVAECGVLLTTATQLKRKADLTYVGVDTGMNSLIRPALYGAFHPIANLVRPEDAPTMRAHVVGPICETGDTLGYDRRLPETVPGDVIVIANTGAYGRAMSSNYNLRPPAEESVIDLEIS